MTAKERVLTAFASQEANICGKMSEELLQHLKTPQLAGLVIFL